MWSILGTWSAVGVVVVLAAAFAVWRRRADRPFVSGGAMLLLGIAWMYVLLVPLASPGNGDNVQCSNTTLNAVNEPNPLAPETSAALQQGAESCREAARWRYAGGVLVLGAAAAALGWRRRHVDADKEPAATRNA